MSHLIDCHVHSHFSDDSSMSPQEACSAAINIGLGGIILTDHVDLMHPIQENKIIFDFEKRKKVIEGLAQKYEGTFKILNGIEIGFQPQARAVSEEIIRKNSFDFVINSTHVVESVSVCHSKFEEKISKESLIKRYLLAILQSVECFDDFDSVGHIGYICRYIPFQDKSFKYADYADILDSLLKLLIHKGKGLEVNTAGFKYNLDTTHPGFDVLTRYKELGGEIITLGSDAHSPHEIGQRFDSVVNRLAAIGFQYCAYFENRNLQFIKII